jgi:hypothetical protein
MDVLLWLSKFGSRLEVHNALPTAVICTWKCVCDKKPDLFYSLPAPTGLASGETKHFLVRTKVEEKRRNSIEPTTLLEIKFVLEAYSSKNALLLGKDVVSSVSKSLAYRCNDSSIHVNVVEF